ncbi:hypothetical protein Bca52824_055250 [Brassica carinata]|uniref:Uncharacterized protein n=1 Tax=Brassica carinata TaxID=52824 RepID=A0A8X7R907_BRACI|nr:hypothetical protein Bca52824_055250 [Brassica carinata]
MANSPNQSSCSISQKTLDHGEFSIYFCEFKTCGCSQTIQTRLQYLHYGLPSFSIYSFYISHMEILFVSKYALYSLLMSLQIKSWSGPSATKSENLFSESKNSRPRHGRHLFVDGPSTL